MLKFGLYRKVRWAMVVGGLLFILFGVFVYLPLPEGEHNLSMLMGMFSGAGTGIFAVGMVAVVQNRRMTPAQKRQVEIDCKDERNIAIQGKAFYISGCVAAIFFISAAFLLVGLGYRVPAYLVLGGLCLQVISLFAAEQYYRKHM